MRYTMPSDSYIKGECPYGVNPCPKIEDVQDDIDRMKDAITEIQKSLYIVIGILTINLGVTLI